MLYSGHCWPISIHPDSMCKYSSGRRQKWLFEFSSHVRRDVMALGIITTYSLFPRTSARPMLLRSPRAPDTVSIVNTRTLGDTWLPQGSSLLTQSELFIGFSRHCLWPRLSRLSGCSRSLAHLGCLVHRDNALARAIRCRPGLSRQPCACLDCPCFSRLSRCSPLPRLSRFTYLFRSSSLSRCCLCFLSLFYWHYFCLSLLYVQEIVTLFI